MSLSFRRINSSNDITLQKQKRQEGVGGDLYITAKSLYKKEGNRSNGAYEEERLQSLKNSTKAKSACKLVFASCLLISVFLVIATIAMFSSRQQHPSPSIPWRQGKR